MDFNVMVLNSGYLRWQAGSNLQGYDSNLLRSCHDLLPQAKQGSLVAEEIPLLGSMTLHSGLPRGNSGSSFAFHVRDAGDKPFSIHAVILPNSLENARLIQEMARISDPIAPVSPELGEKVVHIPSPVLLSSLMLPLGTRVTQRSLDVVREVSRHLAYSFLKENA